MTRRDRIAMVGLLVGLGLALTAAASAGTLAERVFDTTLANGLRVLIVEEPKAPVVTITTPKDGTTTNSNSIQVLGKIDDVKDVMEWATDGYGFVVNAKTGENYGDATTD